MDDVEKTNVGELLRELGTHYRAVEFHGEMYIGRLPGRSDTAGEILDSNLNVVAGPFDSVMPTVSGSDEMISFENTTVHGNDGIDMSKMSVTGFQARNYLGVQERTERGHTDKWDVYETINLNAKGKETSRETQTIGAPYSVKRMASSGK